MRSPEDCPADKDKCSLCVNLAKEALERTLYDLGDSDEHGTVILVEDSRVGTLVQRSYIHEALPDCGSRQRDATIVGIELGKRIHEDLQGR